MYKPYRPRTVRPNPLKLPIDDRGLAIETAAMLQRITGDSCTALYEDHHRFVVLRQSPCGKMFNG
jgi:hypothetical protein